jgi:hypothetical protein
MDVAAFSAAIAGLPDVAEMQRERASGNLIGFATAMQRVTDVATAVAERDYPQLGAGYEACRAYLVSTDGGLTYQYAGAYQAACQQISDRFAPPVDQELAALLNASDATNRAAIGNALR